MTTLLSDDQFPAAASKILEVCWPNTGGESVWMSDVEP
jgi:hypothetical protein